MRGRGFKVGIFVSQVSIFTFLLAVHKSPMRDRLFWCVAKARIVIILILFEGGLLCVEK